ncbi:hypothetical protein LSH36_157g04090 [Paralvinella palmiformis]|uniref:Cadherin domain-containing protein n=1 Tax=Paralvinella palmiformis TaxID=53620 RepID=A0AAD9N709_9ANNE|nr:hypothetical protein LSH36_157g04090 [Paralvinella palmiformis]
MKPDKTASEVDAQFLDGSIVVKRITLDENKADLACGHVILRKSLDREQNNFHKLMLSVTDGVHVRTYHDHWVKDPELFAHATVAEILKSDPRSILTFARDVSPQNASTHIGVFVDDVNDNAPRFETDQYEFTIPEESRAGTVVGQVVAMDVDLGDSGDVSYYIKPGPYSDVFSINKGGAIRIEREGGSLDREKREYVHLKVIATDQGQLPLKSTVDVIIHLDDINDNVPMFTRPVYHGSVDEGGDTSIPRPVTVETAIKANDADATPYNRDVIYSLRGDGSELFRIHPSDALIEVAHDVVLDAESRQRYRMQVVATDRNDTGMSGFADVIINVNDINDNTPFFKSNSTFTIRQDSPIGRPVGHVTAKDDDVTETNNRIIYLLRSGGFGKFSVDFETGNITVADKLDREPRVGTYRLQIDALDGGLPRRKNTTLVTVDVLTNRRPVVSESSAKMAVDENVPVGTLVGILDAYDPDGESSSLKYVMDGDSKAPFVVNENSGQVFTTSALDYERQTGYAFTIYVIDEGSPQMTSNASVVVSVNDVNDVAPVFLSSRYEGMISEDDGAPNVAQIVYMPINITTVDRDSSPGYRNVHLSLHGQHSDYFYIDSDTDLVRVSSQGAGHIDREDQDHYQLILRAADNDNPALYSEVDYIVHIKDINDNGPVFVAPPDELLVEEDARVGDVIGRIEAKDVDATSPNNEVLYIMESDPFGKFRLDTKTGEVSILSGLFYQPRQPTYNITVTAIDLGTPRKQAQLTVMVRVLKRHFRDFRPEFLGDTIFHTPEEVPVGTVVGSIKFTDEGLSPGDTVQFRIDSKTPGLYLAQTGDVITTSRLDSDSGPRWYKLRISATDINNPQHKGKTTIGIILQDVNDNPPRFTRYEYRHRVADTFPPDTIVATPFAYDDLDTEQSTYNYSLQGHGAGKYFVIDPKSGVVKTTEALNEVEQDTMEFGLMAQDLHQRSLVALARLVIDVTRSEKVTEC